MMTRFIGFVDMLDLATLCVAHFDQPVLLSFSFVSGGWEPFHVHMEIIIPTTQNPSTSKFEDLHIRSVVDLSVLLLFSVSSSSLPARVGPIGSTDRPYSFLLKGRDTWLPLERTAPLHDLFSFLSKPHVHRVPIIDPKG